MASLRKPCRKPSIRSKWCANCSKPEWFSRVFGTHFALTAHSPVGLNPDKFRVKIENEKPGPFANNDLQFRDLTGIDHDRFSEGLRKSLFNYMHGICFDFPLQDWFDFKVPRTTIAPDFIRKAIDDQDYEPASPNQKIVWLGWKCRASQLQQKEEKPDV